MYQISILYAINQYYVSIKKFINAAGGPHRFSVRQEYKSVLILKLTLADSSCRADGTKGGAGEKRAGEEPLQEFWQEMMLECRSLWISWLHVLGGMGRGHREKGPQCLLDSWLCRDE